MPHPTASLVASAALLAAVTTTGAARADHCDPTAAPPGAWTWSGKIEGEAASYDDGVLQASWLGARATLGLGGGRWLLRASAPAFRLQRNGMTSGGLGDVAVDARFAAWRSASATVALGPALGIGVPTGDHHLGLGMGHLMAMPGLWWAVEGGAAVTVAGVVAFGTALGAGDHAGHDGGAIVDPMNSRELVARVAAGRPLFGALRADLGLSYAEPVAIAGQRRGIAGASLEWAAQHLSFGAGIQVPFLGDPFTLRTTLALGLRI